MSSVNVARLAYIFPGQGSQYVGMGRDLWENYGAAREVFEEADDALGFKLSTLCFEGPSEELQLTENTQPAILVVSVAAFRAMKSEGLPARPDYVAGHSLGEYSALVAAGSLSLPEAVRVVRSRGRYMQEAVPVGMGAMAAIVGKGNIEAAVRKACDDATQEEGEVCSPANINAPHQVVISGHTSAVERAMELLKESPVVRRMIKLNVSAPFHCSLMKPAQELLAADLEQLEFKDTDFPLLVSDVDSAVLVHKGDDARRWLVRQVTSPVEWKNAVESLAQREHVKTFVEVGPGKVLSGLVRHTANEAATFHIEGKASLEAARAALAVE